MNRFGALTGAALFASLGTAHAEASNLTLADGTPLPDSLAALSGCVAKTAHDGTKTISVVAGDALHKVELVVDTDRSVANTYSMGLGDNYDGHGFLITHGEDAEAPNPLEMTPTAAETAYTIEAVGHICERATAVVELPATPAEVTPEHLVELASCFVNRYGVETYDTEAGIATTVAVVSSTSHEVEHVISFPAEVLDKGLGLGEFRISSTKIPLNVKPEDEDTTESVLLFDTADGSHTEPANLEPQAVGAYVDFHLETEGAYRKQVIKLMEGCAFGFSSDGQPIS